MDVGYVAAPTFEDIDNDGDKDAFIGERYGTILYYKNAPSVLPVELVRFGGKNTEGGNLLTWATASEVNNKGFQVERLNGNDWQTLSFVNGNNKASTYTFTDNAPLATSYYRLRQMDNDGKETLSKVISLQSSQKGAVKVFPTITRDVLTVEGAKSFQIINAAGQVVLRGGQEGSGNFESSPNLSGLPNGIYIVKGVNTEGGVFVEKVVKQ